ncbi:MAG: serine hydrolase [Ignavibacteriales bacterium]
MVGGLQACPVYAPLEAQIRDYLRRDPARWGIHFLDLGSRATFGINPNLPIPQASTVKIPIILYLNCLIAQGRLSWGNRVAYDPETDYRGGAGVLQFFAKKGNRYSLRFLSNILITLSDNVAKAMLVKFLGAQNIVQFMAGLGATEPHVAGEDPTTAADMTLYLDAVLRFAQECPALGCRIIDDLAHTMWNEGLPARLPADIVVAHKEGDITGVSDDVGIVFARHPYILSILSQGQEDIEAGFAKIADISRLVYNYQESVYCPPLW